jgi:hypothetical protein
MSTKACVIFHRNNAGKAKNAVLTNLLHAYAGRITSGAFVFYCFQSSRKYIILCSVEYTVMERRSATEKFTPLGFLAGIVNYTYCLQSDDSFGILPS